MSQIDLFGGVAARDEGLGIKHRKDGWWQAEVFDHLQFCYGMTGTIESFKVIMYKNGLSPAPDPNHSWGAWAMLASRRKMIIPVPVPPQQARLRQAHASTRRVWYVPYPK